MTQQNQSASHDWIARWQRIARRIRVPLGFLTAALYLFELSRRAPQPAAIAWSLLLVLPGLWLRAYAAGYVKKNRELTATGPYAYTRNPLYLGSMLIAAGFAVALLSWPVALAARRRLRRHLHSRHRLGRAISPRHFPRLRRLLPTACRASFPRLTPSSAKPSGSDQRGQLFLQPLSQAPRVQCCNRGRTALPQPAVSAAGRQRLRASAAVSDSHASRVKLSIC